MTGNELRKLLALWQDNNLLSEDQNKKILEFMKERQKEFLFRMLKWFSIIGVLWLIFGVLLIIANLFENFDIFQNIFNFLKNIFSVFVDFIIQPIVNALTYCFGDNYFHFLFGILGLILFYVFFFFPNKKIVIKNIENLNLSNEQKYILKTNFITDIISAICLSFSFFNFDSLIASSYYNNPSFSVWFCLGAIVFIALAYAYKKNIYLIFGIYFVALTIELTASCGYAAYFIIISKPIFQILIGLLLVSTGYFTQKKFVNSNNYIMEKFVSIYYWTGLLLIFLALWVASFWGFNIGDTSGEPSILELWTAHILFILFSLLSMYFGAKSEVKIFFNYGLTFILIEIYSVIFSQVFTNLPVGVASLILGIILIGSAKLLKKVYLSKNTENKNYDKTE